MRPATRLLLAGVGAALLIAGPAMTAAAAPPPGLSVTIADTAKETKPGDSLDYTATISNAGADGLDATLVVTVPSYLSVTDDGGATVKSSTATWVVTVPRGGSVTKSLAVRVGDIPKGELRVTTLASVFLGTDLSQPVIRTADSNTIAGVVDPAHTITKAPAKPGPAISSGLVWIIAGAALLVVVVILVVIWLLVVRRRRGGLSASAPRGHRAQHGARAR